MTRQYKSPQSGNALALVLAGIGLLGTVALGTFNIISGPIETMFTVNKNTVADAQMLTTARIIISKAISNRSLGDNGDCDNDAFVEAPAWRTSATAPTNGGVLPLTLGAPLTDPFGVEYGYCVWDVGAASDDAGCGGPAANRLDGIDNPADTTAEAETKLVFALVSAGPDKTFDTTCVAYTDTTTPLITQTNDDVIMQYSYAEAENTSGGLWTLQAGNEDIAEITRNLEINALGPGGQATIGSDATLTLDAVANLNAVKTDNLYDTSSNGIDFEQNIALVNNGADQNFKGIFTVVPKTVPDTIIETGDGARMYFYGSKAAFRAGQITGGDGSWNNAYTGQASTAFGENNMAIGDFTLASGLDTRAGGALGSTLGFAFGDTTDVRTTSLAVGVDTQAWNENSLAQGNGTNTTRKESQMFGLNSAITAGRYAFACCNGATVSANWSSAIGTDVTASNIYTIAWGTDITVSGQYALGIGLGTNTDTVSDNNTMAIMAGVVGVATTSVTATYELDVNGDMTVSGSAPAPSDKRLKDITGPFDKGLRSLSQLTPVNFRYKKDNPRGIPSEKSMTGLIAQDVQSHIPEAVRIIPGDGFLHMDMKPLNLAKINSVKELHTQNNHLKTELSKMRQDVDRLRHTAGLPPRHHDKLIHVITHSPILAAALPYILGFLLIGYGRKRKFA